MIVIWDKTNNKILHQTLDNTKAGPWSMQARIKNYGFFFNPEINKFPQDGWKLVNGTYTEMSLSEKVEAGIITLSSNQKIDTNENGNEYIRGKNKQELIADGTLNLTSEKELKKNLLYADCITHLNSTKTTNGYICSEAAQKIALASIQMKDLASNDVDKLRMTQQGILYSLEKAREILDYCAAATASFRIACTAVDSAQNWAQVQAIKLESYL